MKIYKFVSGKLSSRLKPYKARASFSRKIKKFYKELEKQAKRVGKKLVQVMK